MNRMETDQNPPGSFFLHRAETTKVPRVEPCFTFLRWHRAGIIDEGMRLIMRLYDEEPLRGSMCRSWHEGC